MKQELPELSKIEQITLDNLHQYRSRYGVGSFGFFGSTSSREAASRLVTYGLAEQRPLNFATYGLAGPVPSFDTPWHLEFRLTDKGEDCWYLLYPDDLRISDDPVHASGDQASWQTRLRAAGYTGKFELGVMIRELPATLDDAPFNLSYAYARWAVTYTWMSDPEDPARCMKLPRYSGSCRLAGELHLHTSSVPPAA